MEQMAADVIVIRTRHGRGRGSRRAAAEVVVIEAMDHIGGNAVWSTAYLTFVDSEMRRRAVIADDEETFVADARSIVEQVQDRFSVKWDEELLRLFARESAETYRLLEARGVRFSRLIPRPRQHSIDRMAAVEDRWMLGRALEPDFASPSVKTHHRSRSTL